MAVAQGHVEIVRMLVADGRLQLTPLQKVSVHIIVLEYMPADPHTESFGAHGSQWRSPGN